MILYLFNISYPQFLSQIPGVYRIQKSIIKEEKHTTNSPPSNIAVNIL